MRAEREGAKGRELIFQFQKVRLWAKVHAGDVLVWVNFNSKRCDYELPAPQKVKCDCVISIPKGAIMSQLFNIKTIIFINFNSKRCDYESQLGSRLAHSRVNFNSKRCDYEIQYAIEQAIPAFDFNSKRCDYEVQKNDFRKTLRRFQFQKVRLWAYRPSYIAAKIYISIPKGAIMSVFRFKFF